MDITTKKWRVTSGIVESKTSKQVRAVSNMPSANTLALMHEKTFDAKCQVAFNTGKWPD